MAMVGLTVVVLVVAFVDAAMVVVGSAVVLVGSAEGAGIVLTDHSLCPGTNTTVSSAESQRWTQFCYT